MKKHLTLLWIIVATVTCVAAEKGAKAAGKGIVERAFAAWNSHDPDKVVAFYTDDVVYEDVALGRTNHGRAELRKFAEDTFAAVPDMKIEAVSSSIHNGRGVVEWIWSGTDKGLFKTDKKFSVRGASVFELRGGKFWRNKDFYDFATIMRQVGALPAEKSGSAQ